MKLKCSPSLAFLVIFIFFLLTPTHLVQAISSEVTVSATVPSHLGTLRLTGYASPNNLVTFLKNGVVVGTTVANSASFFDKTITGLEPGLTTFSIYASDSIGRTTLTVSTEITIIADMTITLSGFLLPPTISVGNSELKRPANQSVAGVALNNATVTAYFNSVPFYRQVTTDNNGNWEAKANQILSLGSHSTNALVQDGDGNQSVGSQTRLFNVILSADLNLDNLVNLTDFSILMYNYGTSNPLNLSADINDNGPVDLQDFSMMMYYWTGD